MPQTRHRSRRGAQPAPRALLKWPADGDRSLAILVLGSRAVALDDPLRTLASSGGVTGRTD